MLKTCLQPVSMQETQEDLCSSNSSFSRAQTVKKAVN